jgi:hypothetical protein
MNSKVAFITLGSFLAAIGIGLLFYGRTEISIICPFGGETPSVANYCLTHENYYLALMWSGLGSVIIGIGLVVAGVLTKSRKKIVGPSRQQETSKTTLGQ